MKKVFNSLKKHKGFTLVEALVVIVIISILSFVIIPNIFKYMEKGKEDYNVKLEKQFELAGRNYFSDNSSKIPRYLDGAAVVTLGELESLGLISGDFYDSNGTKCDLNMSYVKVANKGNNKFFYTPCLKCGETFSAKDECNVDLTTKDSYSCNISLINFNSNKWYNSQSLSEVKAQVNVTKNGKLDDKLMFDYYIADKKVDLTDNSFQLVSNFLSDLKGSYVSITTSGEVNKTYCSYDSTIKLDNVSPRCSLSYYSSPYCSDAGGSGCNTSKTSCSYSDNRKTCTVYDNAGNIGSCSAYKPAEPTTPTTPTEPSKPVEPEKDEISPICTVSSDSTKWYNKDVTVTATCTDNSGSCTVASQTYTFKKSGSHTFEFYDESGNKGTCTAKVNIDKEAPKCTVSKSPTSTWINKSSSTKSVTVYGTCSDTGGSGCQTSKISSGPYKSEGMRNETPGYVYDNAGNKTKCGSVPVYIDLKPPTCAGASRNGTKDGNVQYEYTYTDNVSGVKAEKHGHCYISDNVVDAHKCSTSSPSSRMGSYSSFSSPSTKKTRNYNYNYGTGTVIIYFKLKDVAGNEGACSFHSSPYTYSYKHSW